MTWTDQQLAALPVKAGFRLRGLEMTRLETFCDAACASTTWSACAWQEITMNRTLAAMGILSALFALIMPPAVGVWAGFAYMTLPITMPILAVRFQRAVEQLGTEAAS